MARVTYLLGAGASAGSLPTVEKFETEIADAIRYISNLSLQAFGSIQGNTVTWGELEKCKKIVLNDLTLLLEGCQKHRSVDTYVKRLFLTKGEDDQMYRNTKCSIILFFELYRFMHNKIDKRYDAFLATILDRSAEKFPKDINVLSWNYDYEFERAYLNYMSYDKDIHDAYADMNILHKNNKSGKPLADNFGIIKLNGTIGFYDESGHLHLGLTAKCKYEYSKRDSFELFDLMKAYVELSRSIDGKYSYSPAISFAWEEDYGIVKVQDEIKSALKNTSVIIVIGYSFPYFNRKIDSEIFSLFEHYPTTKIYVQDKTNANELAEIVKELIPFWEHVAKPAKVTPKSGVDQFYMSF